jgi:hypothetical protein
MAFNGSTPLTPPAHSLIRFVLDENIPGLLWPAILQHNLQGQDLIDAVRIGDPAVLPRRSKDPDILIWAEANGRILISFDKRSLPGHLAQHLAVGRHSPGIIILRSPTIPDAVLDLATIATASGPDEWFDMLRYYP